MSLPSLLRCVLLLQSLLWLSPLWAAQNQSNEHASVPGLYDFKYLLYKPAGYEDDPGARWPLILHLHGSGSTGTDLGLLLLGGLPLELEKGRKLPALVVSPQATMNYWNPVALEAFIDDLSHRYRVDPDRISVTGVSLGGIGTWLLGMRHPERYAAIAPLCGSGDVTQAWRMKDLAVWAFHGQTDQTISVNYTLSICEALAKAGGSPRLTIYPNIGHAIWDVSYAHDALYDWLLKQRRLTRAPRYSCLPGETRTLSMEQVPEPYTRCQWEQQTGDAYKTVQETGPLLWPEARFTGATTLTLSVENVPETKEAARFRCIVDGPRTRTTQYTTLAAGYPPSTHILKGLPEHPVMAGTEVLLQVSTEESGTDFQWYHAGNPLPGDGTHTLRFIAGTVDAGLYEVRARSNLGLETRTPLGALVVESQARATNLSSRAKVSAGDEILIAGFVIEGTSSGSVLIRGVGPQLTRFSVAAALQKPILRVYDAKGALIGINQGWQNPSTRGESAVPTSLQQPTEALMARVGAFPLAQGSADTALVLTLPPGSYSAQVSGSGTLAGVALVEVYLLP